MDRPVITERSGTTDCQGVMSSVSVELPTVGQSSLR